MFQVLLKSPPRAKIVRFLGHNFPLEYLLKKLIFFVIVAMFKQENFIAPLLEVIQILDEIGTDEFRKRNMRMSHVLKIASKITEVFYHFDESEHDFKKRFSQILDAEALEKLLELRRKVDIRLMKFHVINLKVIIRDLAEDVCAILDDREMRNLRGSRYFGPFLYNACDFCGCQINPDVNQNTNRECSDCMGKCQELFFSP
jgi:hypothetical protein